jgi:RNA polymerase sigma factor (sigma-70 family)
MLIHPLSNVSRHLRSSVLNSDDAAFSDEQLLTLYIERQEEAAFAALVRRHGSLVWNVCRRVLSDNHDAEDAFQATFLILVRKATDVVPRGMVGNWLYGVAYRTALKARAMSVRRKAREKQVREIPEVAATPPESSDELRGLVDRELNRLPQHYRNPIVLCDLQGKTRNEAAALLGCPAGTLAARHARGRTMLAKRLARYGLTVSGVAIAATFQTNPASAAMPAHLIRSTVAAASEIVAGKIAASSLISVETAELANSYFRPTLLAKLKLAASVLLAAVAISGGIAVSVHPAPLIEADDAVAEQVESAAVDDQVVSPSLGLLRSVEVNSGIWCVAFTHDGKYFITDGSDQVGRLWETASGLPAASASTGEELIFNSANPPIQKVNDLTPAARTTGITSSVALSPDDRSLVTVRKNGKGYLWDTATGQKRGQTLHHRDGINTAAYSPDGKYVATGGSDFSARIWDASTGVPIGSELRHGASVTAVQFLPDGRSLLTSGWDGIIRKWDIQSGKNLGRVLRENRGVTDMSLSRDGRVLLTVSRDRGGQLWDMETGKAISPIFKEDVYLIDVAFSPNNRLFITTGYAKVNGSRTETVSVQLWETASVQPIGRPFEDQDCQAFHPNGKMIATAGDGLARLWDLPARMAVRKPGTADSLEALWTDLANPDATQAYRAVLALASVPERSIPFLEKHLNELPAEDASQNGLVASEPNSPSTFDPSRLRLLRSLHVLEEIGTPAANAVLDRRAGRTEKAH